MKNQQFYIDQVRKLTETGSDYAVAKKLGITRQRMSHYKHGRHYFDDELAFRVAELLKVSPAEVIAAVHLEKSSTPEKQAFWKKALEKAAAAGITAVLAGPLLFDAAQRCILC